MPVSVNDPETNPIDVLRDIGTDAPQELGGTGGMVEPLRDVGATEPPREVGATDPP